MDYFKNDKWHRDGFTPNALQRELWEWQKENHLNPIRKYLGLPVRITSCLRTKEDFDRLLYNGYHPSPTSDHFGTKAIQIPEKYTEKRKTYGEIYQWSTFASDISCDTDIIGLCRDIYITLERDRVIIPYMGEVKQLIAESQIINGKKVYWIHISAPYDALYSHEASYAIKSMLNTNKYLISPDGRNYQVTDFTGGF